MKFLTFFLLIFLIFLIFMTIPFSSFRSYYGNNEIQKNIHTNLNDLALSKVHQISDYLRVKKSDVMFLSESEDVRSIFDEELNYDVGLMAAKIKSISEQAESEIEEYILEHSEMTVEDLQKSEEFQKIAVRRVGETGYTAIHDGNAINYFHVTPEIVGFDLHNFAEEYGGFWKILNLSLVSVSSGFYDWKDADGVIRSKYMHCIPISNSNLIVCATTYIDEYGGSIKLARDLDFELRKFQTIKEYADMIFINSKGDIIWTVKKHNELGTNLVTGVYNDSLLAKVYEQTRNNLGVGITEPDYYRANDNFVSFITSPVFEINKISNRKELLGIVVLELSVDELEKMMKSGFIPGESNSREVYLVNRDFNALTPLKYDSTIKETLDESQGIFSEGIINCFKDYDNYFLKKQGNELLANKDLRKYKNYRGINVLGENHYILYSGWCVIVEENVGSFWKIFVLENKILFLINLAFFILLIIAGFLLSYLFLIRESKKL